MTDDPTHPDFERVFASLDDGDSEPPPYADRLWADLEQTLAREPVFEPDRRGVVVLDTEPPERARALVTWSRVAVAGAVAAAASIAAVVLAPRGEEPIDSVDGPTFTVVVPTTMPVLSDPIEACHRYNESEWSLDRLAESDLTTADFDAALAALEQLRIDLESSRQFSEADLGEIDAMRGSIIQARIEVEAAEIERALRSLDRFGPVTLPDPNTGEPRCAPPES